MGFFMASSYMQIIILFLCVPLSIQTVPFLPSWSHLPLSSYLLPVTLPASRSFEDSSFPLTIPL